MQKVLCGYFKLAAKKEITINFLYSYSDKLSKPGFFFIYKFVTQMISDKQFAIEQ
jgi:hypothetical protein